MGASVHLRTPFTYRVPEDTWTTFFLSNLLFALGPHLLAFRCLWRPAFFLNAAALPLPQDQGKKQQ